MESRVTFARGLAYAALLRPALGNVILALRGEAGRHLGLLDEFRGKNATAWNRQVGEQSVNWGILTIVVCTAESLMASAIVKAPTLADSIGHVAPIAAVPMAAGIGGLLTCYHNRKRIKYSSLPEVEKTITGWALDLEQWVWTCIAVPLLVLALPGLFR